MELLLQLLDLLVEVGVEGARLAHVFLDEWIVTMAILDLLTSLSKSCRYWRLGLEVSCPVSRVFLTS